MFDDMYLTVRNDLGICLEGLKKSEGIFFTPICDNSGNPLLKPQVVYMFRGGVQYEVTQTVEESGFSLFPKMLQTELSQEANAAVLYLLFTSISIAKLLS